MEFIIVLSGNSLLIHSESKFLFKASGSLMEMQNLLKKSNLSSREKVPFNNLPFRHGALDGSGHGLHCREKYFRHTEIEIYCRDGILHLLLQWQFASRVLSLLIINTWV